MNYNAYFNIALGQNT